VPLGWPRWRGGSWSRSVLRCRGHVVGPGAGADDLDNDCGRSAVGTVEAPMRQFIVAKPILHEGENRFGVIDSALRRYADQLLRECGDVGGIGQRLALNAGDHRRVFVDCGRVTMTP
jgi:hypothetical protein